MPAAAAWQRVWQRAAALSAPGRVLQISGQARLFGTAKHQQPKKQHLYLVLDDNPNGFNIHKLDMDNHLDEDVDCGSAESPLCLPDPPILQVGPPITGRFAQFAAIGSHIIGICRQERATLVFDTKKSALAASTVYPLPDGPLSLLDGHEAPIAVGNKLYVFESFSQHYTSSYFPGGFHCLAADLKGAEKHWTWKPLSCNSPFCWSWNKYPPEFPFMSVSICAHVMHPRTGTIFVSSYGQQSPCGPGDAGIWGTYAYGSRGRGEWKGRGDWLLLSKGPGHYDHVLGAWIGLYLGPHPGTVVPDGYLCACPVMSGWQQPQWIIIGREKLCWDDPRWTSTLEDVKLIRMAERGEYCLLERLLPQGEEDKKKCVIRLTTFVVKYGENGELTTMAHRPPRFYKAPSYRPRFDMQAFWM